jgi:DNA polymerase-3 subunit delta
MAKPVYALVGPDAFLQLQKLAEIVKQLPPDVQRIDVDGERAELGEILDELRSFAMFGGAKLVVVRNGDDLIARFREPMEEYVAHPSSGSTLVLRLDALNKAQRIAKAIAKTGQIESCEPPPPGALPRWVVQRGKTAHKVAVDPDAAELLAELIGGDLGRLDTELAKLALFADDGRVTAERVYTAVAFQREQEVKDITLELATGNGTEALRRWRQLVQLDKSAEFKAVTWLGMWLEDVGGIVRGEGPGKAAWKYKDRLAQFTRVAQALGKSGYARALDLLAEVDQQSKTGVGDAAENVERFILDVASRLPQATPPRR